jgi:hypothetical protein
MSFDTRVLVNLYTEVLPIVEQEFKPPPKSEVVLTCQVKRLLRNLINTFSSRLEEGITTLRLMIVKLHNFIV